LSFPDSNTAIEKLNAVGSVGHIALFVSLGPRARDQPRKAQKYILRDPIGRTAPVRCASARVEMNVLDDVDATGSQMGEQGVEREDHVVCLMRTIVYYDVGLPPAAEIIQEVLVGLRANLNLSAITCVLGAFWPNIDTHNECLL
jgi:hypothetical protein